MFYPQSYATALALMLVAMVSWGSWANTMKMVPQFPFQLFYWDYVVGVIVVTSALGWLLGPPGAGPIPVKLALTDEHHITLGLLGGILFNIANVLLVAAIETAGLAVAFPVGIGLALIIGVLLNYVLSPGANPLMLAGGVGLVLAAIVVDALAYRAREEGRPNDAKRGLKLAVASGVLMGLFYPLVVSAQAGPTGLNPYAVAFVFALGVAVCAAPLNTVLMHRPLNGSPPVTFERYLAASPTEHLSGVLGGVIWGLGLVSSLVAASAAIVGPAVSYAVGQGATMVSAVWGVFIWKEFAGAPLPARRLILPMFALFIAGLAIIALAPLYGSK